MPCCYARRTSIHLRRKSCSRDSGTNRATIGVGGRPPVPELWVKGNKRQVTLTTICMGIWTCRAFGGNQQSIGGNGYSACFSNSGPANCEPKKDFPIFGFFRIRVFILPEVGNNMEVIEVAAGTRNCVVTKGRMLRIVPLFRLRLGGNTFPTGIIPVAGGRHVLRRIVIGSCVSERREGAAFLG
jgi:hypothetical protein